jgi:pimeloyl-ACP methyl ester carboxylesterase
MECSTRNRPFVIVILLMGSLVAGCAETFLLHPMSQPIDARGATQQFIEHSGTRIEVYTALSPGARESRHPRAFVLEFTGNATRAEQVAGYIADRWGNRPVEVWVMNYPGFGQSTGPARLGTIPAAALTTYDELSRRARGRPIFVAGNSLGTAGALCVASRRPVAGAILQGPVPLQTMILRRHGLWNLWLLAGIVAVQIPPELNCMDNAPRVHAPGVFILAARDATVPIEYQQMVADAYAGPKQTILRDHAGHNDPITGNDEIRWEQAIDALWKSALGDEIRTSD